ncbi:MAG: hypothetical protein CL927_15705 [Deltaproteobacteria bacterium]|nr:hypothetical protein [Deltaproteobacteria bacterium]
MASSLGFGRIREQVLRVDPTSDLESLAYALDFIRLVLHTLGSSPKDPSEDTILAAALATRTGLSPLAIDTMLRAAREPTARAGVDPGSMRAFAARFGTTSAGQLAEDTREHTTLDAFAADHGSSESLLLLDTLFAVAVEREGGISRTVLEQLRRAARALAVDEVLVTALLRKHAAGLVEGHRRLVLGDRSITIGRSSACDVCLPDPGVAQVHVEIVPLAAGGWRVVDQNSGRPTLLNGVPVSSAPIQAGSVLQVAHYRVQFFDADGQVGLVVEGERSFSALSVRNLTRRIGELSLLDDVSFTVFTGEVVAVVGPSGAGKTTLLHAISAVTPADQGDVLLDGTDFHFRLQSDRSQVGIVPQDDLVHSELTVEESLAYSGRLRFAGNVDREEVQTEVDRVLQELDIRHIRDQRIGNTLQRGISGGQRKRVNLGQELMSRSTRVLFLDEPTSGLDPRASQDIVRQVRQLADNGRIVFLVTHDLTPEVLAQVDHLLVMVPGGRLAFFGPPAEAAEYFQVATPDAIFNRFADHRPETWDALFRESAPYRKFVRTRDHLLGIEGVERTPPAPTASRKGVFWRHLRAQTGRYARIRLRDRTGLAVLAIQPVVLALVMAVVFPAPTPGFFFMLSLSCLWFGMSGSVRELIADRAIWQREARIGLGILPYVLSKALVLGGATLLQCIGLAAVLFPILGLAEYGFSLGLLAAVSGLVGLCGMSIGLFVSSCWTSSEAAVGTLPLLLIPQIAFSSIMVSMRDMGPIAKGLTWITIQRYAFDATLKTGEEMAHHRRPGMDFEPMGILGTLSRLGLKPTESGRSLELGLSLPTLALILSGVTLLLLTLTIALVGLRTRRANR